MVMTAQFSEMAMKKEAAIIEQEMMMYDDDYEQQIYQSLLKQLYSSHPIRHDIAGTIESVEATTYQALMDAYRLFYHPENMVMVVVGNVDASEIQQKVESTFQRYLNRVNDYHHTAVIIDEISKKPSHHIVKKDVAIPMLMMGIRLKLTDTKTLWERAMDDIKMSFLLSGVFGKGGNIYRDLMKRHVINDAFDYFSSYEESYGHLIVFTETKKPSLSKKALIKALEQIKTTLPDEKQFELSKRKLIGEYIQMFDQISQLANQVLDYEMKSISLFDFFKELSALTYDDVLKMRDDILLDSLVSITFSN
jgi:predicted Zn-dependent peptidase